MGYNEFSYGYEAMPSVAAGFGGFFFVFLLLIYLFTFGLSIAVYVMESLSLYTIAKRRGIHHPWMAWVPVVNLWILGSVSDQYQYLSKGKTTNRRKVLLGLNIALVAFSVLMAVLVIIVGASGGSQFFGAAMGASMALLMVSYFVILAVSVVQMVFWYIALYDLYASCEPSNAVLYLILSIVFSITIVIFMFICRKKDLGIPPRRQTAPAQPEVILDLPVQETPVEQTSAAEEILQEVPVDEAPAEEVVTVE